MIGHVLELFRKKYTSGAVRQIGVSYGGFVDRKLYSTVTFDDVEQIEKKIDFRQQLMLSENSLLLKRRFEKRPFPPIDETSR